MTRCRLLTGAIILAAVGAPLLSSLAAAAREAPVPRVLAAQSILIRRCGGCHGVEARSGLDLRSPAGLLRGGSRGPTVVPGDPQGSLLLQAVRREGALKMPPSGKLPPEDIATLEAWIKSKSAWESQVRNPQSAIRNPQSLPWSFRKPARPAVPGVKGAAWVRNSIDAFVLAKLEAKGLRPSPPAARRPLIRRLYFDLLGLPPPPERVEKFAADMAPDAYPKLIDELLAMPQYGERWARHWLDAARYADTGGYETDIYYRNAWRYRDYVVRAFNDDKPYDRFVREQIAGDELQPYELELEGSYKIPQRSIDALAAKTATGLFTLGPQIHESNMDGKKLRYEWLTDCADTTGSVFMGLTVGCARCHDHKFDPISQKDHYALQAVFAGSREVEVPIIDGMGIADYKQHYPRMLALEEARTALERFQQRTQGRPATPAEQQERTRLLERLAGAVQALPKATAQGVPFDGTLQVPTVTTLGHVDPALVPEIRLLNRGELTRPRQAVAPAIPEALRAPGKAADLPLNSLRRRKELALWLTRPDHPLTARVMVNRVWGWHFGQGIVRTPNDFGKMGEAPTHPELLDWLATTFAGAAASPMSKVQSPNGRIAGASAGSGVRNPQSEGLGWSVKKLHRLILLSSTYQQASALLLSPEGAAAHRVGSVSDPDNRLLWRQNRRRLEGEALWDAMHSVAGMLNMKMGGRPVMPPLADEELTALRERHNWVVPEDPAEHTRRGVYLMVRRNFRFPFFEVFDAPINSASCPRRDVTTVAPQALWFLNNRTSLTQATHFAARVVKESGGERLSDGEQNHLWAERVWRLALGRKLWSEERDEAVGLLETLSKPGGGAPLEDPPPPLKALPPERASALVKLCLTMFNLNEFLFVD